MRYAEHVFHVEVLEAALAMSSCPISSPFNLIAAEEQFVKSVEELDSAQLFDEVSLCVDLDEIGEVPDILQIRNPVLGDVQRVQSGQMSRFRKTPELVCRHVEYFE